MTAKSIGRMVVASVALVAACGAAFVFGIPHARREPPVETRATTAAPAVSPPASGLGDQGSAALATAQAEANAVVAALGVPPRSPDGGDEPEFDIARIERAGDAVIAGRAAPGAIVELLRNGELHDRAVADQSGQFAMVPPRLPSGDYELTLRSRHPNGKEVTSKQSVAVALLPSLKDQPVVVLMTPDRASVLLSKPVAANPIGGPVAVETVETEPSGNLHVSGRSPPGAAVRLYLNDSFLASATAAEDGSFAFTINGGIGPGSYRIRLDEVESSSGAVRSRAEVPFNVPETAVANRSVLDQAVGSSRAHQPSEPPPLQIVKGQNTAASKEPQATAATPVSDRSPPSVVVVPKITTTVVSRGDSLWRISRATYGNGMRYAVIYEANQHQIRNPSRIYPGQIFVLPKQER